MPAARLLVEKVARAVLSGRVSKAWEVRFGVEGRAGMQDSSALPGMIPRQTAEALAWRIIGSASAGVTLRNWLVSRATVRRVLKREVAPPEPPRCYDFKEPGGLIHADITKSAVPPRASAQVHLSINDASRIAVTARYPDGKAVSATAALRTAVAHDESPRV